MVWPFEKIDIMLDKAAHNRDRERKNYFRAATHRERFWIQNINSLFPRGFNIYLPLSKQQKTVRRQW